MEYARADRTVTVPKRASVEKWTPDQAQRWAREDILFGGPPAKPSDPETGEAIGWADIKHLAGKKVRIQARPMGLIITLRDGTKSYFPGDATPSSGSSGFSLGTSTEEMRKQAKVEDTVRTFAKDFLSNYNKDITKQIRESERRPATYEFWEAGKRIRAFLSEARSVTQDQAWFALEQWGRGAGGYGKRWLEYATYFYDWRQEAAKNDPVFTLSETRVMNILQAKKDPMRRDRLAEASLKGLFKGFSDEEFKWVTGQSPSTFPLDTGVFDEFRVFGDKIAEDDAFKDDEIARLREIHRRLQASNVADSED